MEQIHFNWEGTEVQLPSSLNGKPDPLQQINAIAAPLSQPPHARLPPPLPAFAETGEDAVSPPPTAIPALSPATLRLRCCSTRAIHRSAPPSASLDHDGSRPLSSTLTNVTATTNTHARRRATTWLSHNL
ncbi:hypothetical protein FH972_001613 [Carpinus fangiana]|uniref:Uncharacterized protein n=1 Tax=Carpinus fangiana TaxID=176857 RepID=A0A5N6QCM8_9ROSI|nr:hypothetical protein FH972_001613 [Carpinus fangiana]